MALVANRIAELDGGFVAALDGEVWAICSGGRLLRATPGAWTWESALPAGAALHVRSVAFAEQ
jgi:hypothetical protein